MRRTIILKITKDEALNCWKEWKANNQKTYKALLIYCKDCESNEYLGVHHKDGDKTNNVVENFECLCFSCHKKLHNREFVVQYVNPYEFEQQQATKNYKNIIK